MVAISPCSKCGRVWRTDLIWCKVCGTLQLDSLEGYRLVRVVSYPKSGRTWLAHLWYHYTLKKFGVTDLDYGFTYNPHLRKHFQKLLLDNAADGYPIVSFHHAGSRGRRKQRTRLMDKARSLLDRPVLHLARDPARTVVSMFHHMRTKTDEAPRTLTEFIQDKSLGLAKIVDFLNTWAEVGRLHLDWVQMSFYEDLLANTEGEFREIVGFFDSSGIDTAAIIHAVRASDFDTMQRSEIAKRESVKGAGPVEQDELRVRVGKSGDSKELSQEDRSYIRRVLVKRLDRQFQRYLR